MQLAFECGPLKDAASELGRSYWPAVGVQLQPWSNTPDPAIEGLHDGLKKKLHASLLKQVGNNLCRTVGLLTRPHVKLLKVIYNDFRGRL